ncbi:helix-turn-helix domain-containing protein [Bacillus sp. 123MFChir2]|uniref:helix-turn-helix domain-containing protein n=1 Tax=Bacillus sp. 123MFChir2 TaxID=1169144 RepID=UPI00036B0DF6|nr:helix-turn-helix domain-containing protein [Bacillus sp. 123MFChir2]
MEAALQLQYTVLYCLKQLKGERTVSSIYHLLKGKRSSQTFQDGNMFHLSFLFGVYKSLRRHNYDKQIETLLNAQLITCVHENTYILSDVGEKQLNEWEKICYFPKHLQGLHYGELGESFWKRLSLIIQTVSNLKQQNVKFIPIQQDKEITIWVKRFIMNSSVSREYLAEQLYKEINVILMNVTSLEATILVYRLTGYHRIGYTTDQLGDMMRQDTLRVYLLFWGTIHFIIQQVQQQKQQFPLLTEIIAYPNEKADLFSISTQKTYQLWKQGRTIDEIARIRKLKVATIEDHIVEIALREKEFQVEHFIEKEKMKQIQNIIEKLQTRKLRILKQAAGEHVSYFEIRLVLARIGGLYET